MSVDLTTIWFGLVLTGLFCIGACWKAWERYRDPFHPVFFLALPCFAAYFLQPALLLWSDSRGVLRYLTQQQLEFVVLVNGLGTVALVGAALRRFSSSDIRRDTAVCSTSQFDHRKLMFIAYVLGAFGVAAFAYTIRNVGGLANAYSRSHGGGYSSVGYIQDAYWLCLPAVAMLFRFGRRNMANYAAIALFSSPFFIHGILGARRGPTASILICLVVAYGLAYRWRPKLWQFAAFLAGVGLLMLVLAANRRSLHLGSEDMNLNRGVESYVTSTDAANEFIYGGATITIARLSNKYSWGGRYATVVFIRPIPRFVWETKYEFAERVFGVPNLADAGSNFGTGGGFMKYLGWSPPFGSAPGLIADLWLEFWWGSLVVLYLIGSAYRHAWRHAVVGDLFWTIGYVLMAALSIYLVAQALEAMLFRFLLAVGGTTLAWIYATGWLPRFFPGKHRGAKSRVPARERRNLQAGTGCEVQRGSKDTLSNP